MPIYSQVSRRITHAARLRDYLETIDKFVPVEQGLDYKLGVLFFQFPQCLHCNLRVLDAFLSRLSTSIRVAFEFRHGLWPDDPTGSRTDTHLS